MRVLRISHSATVGAWRGRERALRHEGVDVSLLTARRWHAGGAEVALDAADEDYVRGVRTWGRHPALFLYSPLPLWRALGERWDVIDIHEEPFALATAEILLLRLLRRSRARYVLYSAQNIRKRYPIPFRWFERTALTHASGISVCNSEAGAICVDKGFPGRPRVIPLGVDPSAFAPDDDPSASHHGSEEQPFVVGYLGRLVPEKGVDVLIDALVREPRLRVRVAGSGPIGGELALRARALAVDGRVDFVGPVSPEDAPTFLRDLDALAVPSRPTAAWTEQFGRVAVEAMACGVPVVVSDAGALPEVVGRAGIVVPVDEPEELAAGLMSAAGDRRDELRAAGLLRARGCSWDAVAHQYLDLYRSALPASPLGEPCVEVIVVAYGSPDLLRAALEPVTDLPVTVVDNSSLTEIADLCRTLGVRYIDAGANRGFAAGVNIGLANRLAPDSDVLLLNPDARIERDQIAALSLALHSGPRIASAGPAQVDDHGRTARVAWPFPSPGNTWLQAIGLGRLQYGARYVIGSVLLLRADALDQVGGFDESFFLYAEETDWAFRAHRLGWVHRFVPDARAVHVGGATSSDVRLREARFHASQERYYRKHFGAAGWQSTRAAVLLGSAIRAFLLQGERAREARRRASLYRLGPIRIERRLSGAGPATAATIEDREDDPMAESGS